MIKQELNDPGSGKYPAGYLTDSTLPKHTLYAPKTPPAGTKMPVLVWGEGGCLNGETTYSPLLTEIASHGYLVLVNGPLSNGLVTLGKDGSN
jgi:hypothetical protein